MAQFSSADATMYLCVGEGDNNLRHIKHENLIRYYQFLFDKNPLMPSWF